MTYPSGTVPLWLKTYRPEQVRTLDPRRHALIEASAGTGKTFAIEHLVMRLLVENPRWNPEEILLLSFTDKTVAELRDRIRKLLRAQIDGSAPEKRLQGWQTADLERLRQVWLHADDLSVHTLHAFCQAALRRDPVVNNALIRAPLTDDGPMVEIALDHLLRGAWSRDPDRLEKLARALGVGSGDAWRKKLMRLALKWQPWRSDTLDPAGDPGTVEALVAQADTAVAALSEAIKAVEGGAFPIAAYRRSFAFTKTGRPAAKGDETLRKHAFQKVFVHVERGALSVDETLKFFLKDFTNAMKVVKGGWAPEIPPEVSSPEWVRLAGCCEGLRDLAVDLEKARHLQRLGLLAEATRELRAALDEEKLRRGLISYDDMPRNLVEALRRNPTLARRLRGRYKACIVDEFQDTDPLQWEILEALCLESEEVAGGDEARMPALPLFLVGDPKQAIYSFRGGDLRTYMTARARFRALAAEGRAQGVGLDANFRSNGSLIRVLNAMFSTPDWFGPAPAMPPDDAWHLPGVSDEIVFTPVHAGRTEDGQGRGPVVWLRDFSAVELDAQGKPAYPSKSDIQREVREWIVSRIAKAQEEKIPLGDFAVLTRNRSEGESIARRLRQCGIPFRIRRQGGIWSGPSADALRLLLEWIADAANPDAQARILLLPFVANGVDDRSSQAPKGRPDQCPPLIARWAALALAGRWPEFFESVHQEGGYRERLERRSPEEAVRFEQLITRLSESGAAPGTTPRALCERFDALRRGEEISPGDEGETDAAGEAVTVMTLHLSKGLEFPHVFIAATGVGRKDDFLVLRDADAKGFRIALNKDDAQLQAQADQEARAEDKRLYYVGLTRARESLYVPLLPSKFSKTASGPLGDFVAAAIRAVAQENSTRALIRMDEAPLWNSGMIGRSTRGLAPEFATSLKQEESQESGSPDRKALVDQARALFERRRQVSSFSGLAHRAGEPTEVETLLDEAGSRAQRQEPEADVPEETPESTPVISAEDLPPGTGAGTALHAIFEHTVFASVLASESAEAWLALPGHRARVEEALQQESVPVACAPAAARAVWNTLRMPLPDPSGGPAFRLADLEGPQDYRHEVEFLLTLDLGSDPASASFQLEGVARRGDFLWGFIDLVYRKNGRYYLLDWKSNLLPGYDEASVRRSMLAHRYDLQWKLYSIALHRWLHARLPDYDFHAHFGGVHYLFVRGSAPERFSGFHTRPTFDQVTVDFPAELGRLIRAPLVRAFP